MSIYIIPFLITFILSIIFTKLVIKLAIKFKILDYPNSERKIHKTPIPLLGGTAVFSAFCNHFYFQFYLQSLLSLLVWQSNLLPIH